KILAKYLAKSCSEHSYSYSIKYGSEPIAIQVGFEQYSNVKEWFSNVSEVLLFKFSKTKSFLEFSLTHIGKLSVMKIRLESTGIILCSPSVKLPALAVILYSNPCNPFGI